MKTKLLLIALLGTLGMNAQATHMVDWFMGVQASETTITIDEGDTVIWTWMDNLPHTVTSTGGTESFNSGTKTGNGQTFTHVFDAVGATTYACGVHPMMQGTVTVEAVMGVEDQSVIDFKYFPNPTNDVLTLTAAQNIDRVDVYDMNGRLLMTSTVANPTVKVYMSAFAAGTYYIKANIGERVENISVVKQ